MPTQSYDPNKLLERGRSVLGGIGTDAAIADYIKTGGVNLNPAQQDWCAAYVNATLGQEGFPLSKNPVRARDLENYGEPVLTPQAGDIGVFARHEDVNHTSPLGHAAFYTGEKDLLTDRPIILSGNAGDQVVEHPMDDDRLIEWRRPPGVQELPRQQSLMSGDERLAMPDRTRNLPQRDERVKPRSPVGKVGGTDTVATTSYLNTPNTDWEGKWDHRYIVEALNKIPWQEEYKRQQFIERIRGY